MPRSIATKKGTASKPGEEEKDEEEDNSEGKENFDDKETTMLLSDAKEQAQFELKVSSDWMKNERIPADYRDKRQEVQFKFVSEYMQSRITP